MPKLGRVLTAMVTPFTKDLKVNYDEAQMLANYLLKNGSEGIVVSGTTGESPTLTTQEKKNLFRSLKEAVADKGTIIAGTGNYCTQESIELTREAEKIGVDAVMLVTPYYNKPPQEGLYNHFKSIAEATSLPVIIYNIPSRSVVNLNVETVVALAQTKNIMGIKEASGNLEQIAKIISDTSEDFVMYSGDDSLTYPVLTLGGDGVISVAAHLAGNEMSKMVTACSRGQWEKARRFHLQLFPLFKALFLTTNPIMVKAGLKLKGFDTQKIRSPLVEANEQQIQTLRKVMNNLGLI